MVQTRSRVGSIGVAILLTFGDLYENIQNNLRNSKNAARMEDCESASQSPYVSSTSAKVNGP